MSDYITNVNESTFQDEVIKCTKPVFMDFRAPWCSPCRVLGSVVELLAEKYHDNIKFVKINVDENPNLAKQFQISGIPNIKIIEKNKILHDLIGVKHPDEYESILNNLSNSNK